MKSRISCVGKVLRGIIVFSCRVKRMIVKSKLYEGVAVPTTLYEAESWSMLVIEKERLNVIEMKYLE